MNTITVLKKEHEKIRELLLEIESFIKSGKDHFYITSLLERLGRFWDKHEEREERLFKVSRDDGKPFPNDTMLVEQHRELKGHWKVLNEAAKHGDKKKFSTALDTDGKMLIEKFRKHIGIEDDFFDVILNDIEDS